MPGFRAWLTRPAGSRLKPDAEGAATGTSGIANDGAPAIASVPVAFEHGAPSIAMSTAQYERIKQKIRESSNSSHTSIWLALALTFAGIAATLWTTVLATSMSADIKGKLELGGWFSLVLVLVFMAMHMEKHAQHKAEVDDIIEEMETYSYHRTHIR